ncbi:MAG: hypothetical protein OXG62_15710, partial [Nitrospinae bacterium]|nr:hypothetical protein [Nitrospinota bacterium]
MRMLKYLRLAVFVVCIAAFASGCGGDGGGSGAGTTDSSTTPPEQEQTDAERIAAARQTVAGIVATANNLAQTASSAAAAVGASEDATAEQIASATSQNNAAQSALGLVVSANAAAIAATTPAQAQTAVADANAALADLRTAQSAVAGIQTAVNAVAVARRQREADETALTNNSSLIKHVRDNKLLSDALLADLVADRLLVGPAGAITRNEDDTESCTAPCATYAANTGTGATRVVGQRTVRIGTLVSGSTTPSLSGTGPLPHGFDMKDAAGANFVNAYTDIMQTRINVRTRTNVVNDDPDTEGDQRYANQDFPDTDYLLAGIWLTVGASIGDSTIQAFAYGNQPTSAASTPPNFCSGIEASDPVTSGATTTDRNCVATSGLNSISGFVDDGQDVTATYRGDANGAYIAGGATGYFTADVTLTAEFQNPTGGTTDGTGSIQGAVTNITAGGQSIAGSIELQKQSFNDDIGLVFAAGTTIGVVDGKSYSGIWKGQFFG